MEGERETERKMEKYSDRRRNGEGKRDGHGRGLAEEGGIQRRGTC